MIPKQVASSADEEIPGMDEPLPKHRAYWRRNVALTAFLLAVWFVVTFVVAFHARELNTIKIFGFPFGFYMGAQGSLLIYLLIVWIYAKYMNRLDDACDVESGNVACREEGGT